MSAGFDGNLYNWAPSADNKILWKGVSFNDAEANLLRVFQIYDE